MSSKAIDSRSEVFDRQCVLIVSRNAGLTWRLRSLLPGFDHYTVDTRESGHRRTPRVRTLPGRH